MGLGAERDGGGRNLDRDRAAVRDSMQALNPPTREEVARTIFIGGLGEHAPSDAAIERILLCAGKLRRWTRARDADDKVCKFGFAEFEDSDSLDAATEIFVGLEVPMFTKGVVVKDEETGKVKKMSLLVVVDEQSKNYIDEWKGRSRREDEEKRQFRIDGCKEDLTQTIASLQNLGAFLANGVGEEMADAIHINGNGENGDNAEVVNINVALEDELSDIPAEQRATVAAEIRAFRDRSTRRDLERLKREEELDQAERQRSELERGAPRVSRLASPPRAAPSGPSGASNGIPLGPRGAVPNAPSGPRGFRGVQMPSDYTNGVSFVGADGFPTQPNEDEDDSASDDELERRRKAKRDEATEQQFERVESNWLRRENQRAAAQGRQRTTEANEERRRTKAKDDALKVLSDFNDDDELRKAERQDPTAHEYYLDHTSWARRRQQDRDAETRGDARDRDDEARETGEANRRQAEARGLADDSMDQMDSELSARSAAAQPSAGFKISLGSAAARTKAATTAAQPAPTKRGMADVENLLEDEEEAASSGLRRNLGAPKPLPAASAADMTAEERSAVQAEIAKSIPTSTEELFAFPIRYEFLTKEVIESQIRPFVEKKVVEYLGVQEELLVEAVLDGLRDRKGAREVAGVLEEALEEEGEVLVRKVWRLAVFWGECGGRGFD